MIPELRSGGQPGAAVPAWIWITISRMPEYKSPQQESGTERRFLLVFLLIAVVIFGSQWLMKKYMPQQPPSTAKPVQPIQAPAAQAPGPASPQSAVPQSIAGGGARATTAPH